MTSVWLFVAIVSVLSSTVAFPATEASAATATITLSPSEGPAGSSVTVAGKGFARHARGAVTVAGGTKTYVRANKYGRFKVQVQVPKAATGQVKIGAKLGTRSASALYTVQALIPAPSPTPTPTPTEQVPLPEPSASVTHYRWDGGTEQWATSQSGASVAHSTTVALHGAGSLRLERSMGSGWASIRAHDGNAAVRDIRAGGDTLTAWAHLPSGTAGRDWQARIEVQDVDYTWHFGPYSMLRAGEWVQLTYTVPTSVAASARRFGVQFEGVDVNGAARLHLDTLQQSTAVAASPTPTPTPEPTPEPQPSLPAQDALQRRAQAELKMFTDWLAVGGAKGYVGEVGWPGDDARWNDLARVWYADAARNGLWVTNWATGEWWGGSYKLSTYAAPDARTVSVANPQAAVIESQQDPVLRGINVNGGEFGAVSGNPAGSPHTSSFSNLTPGTYDRSWHYDRQATFDYLAARGVTTVRLPFRWERIQPTLGGPLDATELSRLIAAIDRAGAAGMKVIPDMHNYGAYYLHDGTTGVRRTMGSAQLTHTHFADVWRRLSVALKNNSNVLGYGLMNEPVATASGASGWEAATQDAVNAIRANGDTKTVLVPGYNWSTVVHFSKQHPKGPWIEDAAGNVRYEAHHYFDRDNSGNYASSYDVEVSNAVSRGY